MSIFQNPLSSAKKLGDYDLFSYQVRLFNEPTKDVVWHEYLHHLQNITTLFGVERLNFLLQISARIASLAKQCKEISLTLPLPLKSAHKQLLEKLPQNDIGASILTDALDVIGHFRCFEYLLQPAPFKIPKGRRQKNHEWIDVTTDWYYDNTEEKIPSILRGPEKRSQITVPYAYPVGALAGSEGQAHCHSRLLLGMQQWEKIQIWDESKAHQKWAYNLIPDQLAFLGIENPEWTVLALAEIAFNISSPLAGLTAVISQIESGRFKAAVDAASALDLFDQLFQHNKIGWEMAYDIEMECLDELYQNCKDQYDPLKDVIYWSIEKLQKGLSLRKENPSYFIEHYLPGREKILPLFLPPIVKLHVKDLENAKSIVSSLGFPEVPLVTEKNGYNIEIPQSEKEGVDASQMFAKLSELVFALYQNPENIIGQTSHLELERQTIDKNTVALYPKHVEPDMTNHEGILLRILNLEGLPLQYCKEN